MPTKQPSKPTKPERPDDKQDPKRYRAPVGSEKTLPFPGDPRRRIEAKADWIVLRERGLPTAEVFHVSYTRTPVDRSRPIMFLFNGGPGAASAFLHLGTAGPRRVAFGATGTPLPPPATLEDNLETWLAFTDLVFVDPVGTGFSRTVSESRLEQSGIDDDDAREKRTKELPDAAKGFFKIKRDIASLCDVVVAYLSKEDRWLSPVSIAGESYGGFRVGKLMRALPERGVGLASAVMISPAVDFLGVNGSDYDLASWMSVVPSMAATARFHGKARGDAATLRPDAVRAAAQTFAETELASILIRGNRAPERERTAAFARLADLVGLPRDLVRRAGGRIPIELFARELLRDEGLVCGLYDGSVTGPNVFPDREGSPNPEPTLGGIMTAFTSGINAVLRTELGVVTDREYHLLNEDAWKQWVDDQSLGYWHRQLECADDMRYGLALNPKLRVLVAHGWFDLVTTYFATQQTIDTLRLPDRLREQIVLRNYDGGHMFYTWDASRKAVATDVARCVAAPEPSTQPKRGSSKPGR
jgi:carboxypeptidase C (cathepsin A)